ncbi:MAG: hypothetical protein K9K30_14375 [Burkholderiaceae bacterium]|nr:hypothetical protein [Sulfuritalea sp.]MCF8176421.1 hypothetical protein [Burkholderiaceae bacterium]MCF8184436.1 hypothetical protein [Polynucleobacter sp.]
MLEKVVALSGMKLMQTKVDWASTNSSANFSILSGWQQCVAAWAKRLISWAKSAVFESIGISAIVLQWKEKTKKISKHICYA